MEQKLSKLVKIKNKINIFIFLATFSVLGCGGLSLENKTYLTVKMVGNLVAPSTATGGQYPAWQEYTLQGVYLSPDPESGEVLSLFNEDPKTYKIVSRPQIIYQKEIPSTWVGKSFESLILRFDTGVTAAGKFRDDYQIVLDSSDIIYETSFMVEEGRGIVVTVNVNWKNTITRNDDTDTETWTLPDFVVSVDAQ